MPVAIFPEGVMLDSNAITLCRSHHNETKGKENVFAEFLAGLISESLAAVPRSHRGKNPVDISSIELYRLYHDEGLSTIEIGRIKNCDPTYLQKIMKKLGIPRRTPSDAAASRVANLRRNHVPGR